MKYLAILKDSVREAIDAKIFYVTVILSVLVSLLVLTIGYQPVPMEDMVKEYTKLLNFITESGKKNSSKFNLSAVRTVEIEDFKRLDEGTEPWTGQYRFTMDMELWDDDKEPKDGPAKDPPGRRAQVTADSLQIPIMVFYQWFDNFTVKALPATDTKRVRFEVQTKGIRRGFRTRPEWYHQPTVLFGLWAAPLRIFKLERIVRFIGDDIVGTFGAGVTMLLSCILTAFFIPNMMAKGNVDLLIVKPINRVTLFVYKFLGGTTFMLLNTTIIMVGVWAGLGLQSGYWVHWFLLCIPVFTFEFLMFYSVSVFAGVLTRSPIASILAVIVFWALFTVVGWAYWIAVESYNVQNRPSGEVELEDAVIRQPPEHWAVEVIKFFHAIMPRYKDIDWLTAKEIKGELIKPEDLSKPEIADNYRYQLQVLDRQFGTYSWGESIAVTTVFILVFSGFATFWFATRDY